MKWFDEWLNKLHARNLSRFKQMIPITKIFRSAKIGVFDSVSINDYNLVLIVCLNVEPFVDIIVVLGLEVL